MITQQQLKEHLSYDQNTGIFISEKTYGQPIKGKQLGTLHSTGYIVIRINDKLYKAHRLAWLYIYGEFPACLDHINRVRSDNRIANLRSICQKQNTQNSGLSKSNRSGLKGVGWCAKLSKWRAKIMFNRKTIHLGYFADKNDAHIAYCKAAKKYHSINPYAID